MQSFSKLILFIVSLLLVTFIVQTNNLFGQNEIPAANFYTSNTTSLNTSCPLVSIPQENKIYILINGNQNTTEICSKKPYSTYIINYPSMGAYLNISTYSSCCFEISATNVTNNLTSISSSINGTFPIKALNITLTGGPVSANVTVFYPCGLASTGVVPYHLQGTWEKTNGFSINTTSCTISFPLGKNSTFGIFNTTAKKPLIIIPRFISNLPSYIKIAIYGIFLGIIIALVIALCLTMIKLMKKRMYAKTHQQRKKHNR
jgi:hypothetical protein